MLASYWPICSYVVDLWPQPHPYWPTERSALHMCEHAAFTLAISQQALFKTVNKSLQSLQVFCNFQTIKHRNYGNELSMCKLGWHRMFGSCSQSNSLPFKGNGMPQQTKTPPLSLPVAHDGSHDHTRFCPFLLSWMLSVVLKTLVMVIYLKFSVSHTDGATNMNLITSNPSTFHQDHFSSFTYEEKCFSFSLNKDVPQTFHLLFLD